MAAVNFTGNPLSCCKSEMNELVPNSVDASKEKHKPIIKQKGNTVTVTVGEADMAHPMSEEHSIYWVCLVTDRGSQRKILNPKDKAEATFYLDGEEKVINAFAYCNLHGLWVS